MTPSALFEDCDHIYLSPHLDDAVFSCGGRIAQQTRAGERVLVVTVCAGDPPPGPLSGLARALHERWALPQSAPEARRLEDMDALGRLDAGAIHLALPDCIYRKAAPNGPALYNSEDAIFGPLHPRDWWLSLDLAARLAEFGPVAPRAHLYFPLGIGGHVDHQLTWRLADDWAGAHAHVYFYEDYPYSHDQRLVERWVAGRDWQPHLARLSEADLARKIGAVSRYASQLSSFWADPDDMAARLREHAAQTGGAGGPAERVWYNPALSGDDNP